MAAPTGGMSFFAAAVDVSADGATWTSLDDHGASVASAAGDRAFGEQNTFGNDVPIVRAGQRASSSVTVRFVYTEIALEPWEVCRAIFETKGAACYVRYWPAGRADGNFIYETGKGVMTVLQHPEGEALPGTIVPAEFTVVCAAISKDVSAGGS